MERILIALTIGVLLFIGYVDVNYHPVYSKNCVMTPDGLKCQLDHYERNK